MSEGFDSTGWIEISRSEKQMVGLRSADSMDDSAAVVFAVKEASPLQKKVTSQARKSRFGTSTPETAQKIDRGFRCELTPQSLSSRSSGGIDAFDDSGDCHLENKSVPSRWKSESVIANDRDLLLALGLNDAMAAAYVLKSRQTLNNHLGAERDNLAPIAYFKPAELLVLVLAATRDCPEFDESRKRQVYAYIKRTRDGRGDRAYGLVMEALSNMVQIDLSKAMAVIFLLPEFSLLEREDEEVMKQFKLVASQAADLDESPCFLVISSSTRQARRAADALGLSGNNAIVSSHDNAEHYLPSVLVYEGGDRARAFVASARGTLVAAPIYKSPMMVTCLKEMVPDEVREQVFGSARSPRQAHS